jgi:hypothetical protein
MKKFDLVYSKIINEDAEERAWEHRQIQDAAKKAKAAKKKGQKVNYNKLADEYGVSAGDIKKACNESIVNEEVKRHPILDDKDRLEDILHDLQIIAYKKYISEEGRKNLLAAQDLVAKAADEAQRTISQTNLYPTRNKLPWNK